jgi:folate-binding protein YgfZ
MTDLTTQIDAILHGAAFAPITDRAFLRITGPDATRWLNGMVTNNIKDLKPGEGNYNFLLNAQGRIQGDCTIYRDPSEGDPTYLLETSTDQIETLQQLLDKFIIMDDVELNPHDALSGILVTGQQALSIVMALGNANHQAAPCTSATQAPPALALNLKQTLYAGAPVFLIQAHSQLMPQIEIWSGPATAASIFAELGSTTALPASPEALEAYRILSGTPRYGVDIRNTDTNKDLPQETAQAHALNFNKGCYVGQEIVERIHSRGNVHRIFTPFTLTGELPTVPTPLEANGKSAGELTSVVQIGDTIYALGYARREALDTNATLTYAGGTATPRKIH